MSETSFSNKCAILAELWLSHRSDEEFKDFIEYNDLGLPIAYAIAEGVVASKPMAEQFINESFELLLAGLQVEDDVEFETLEDLLEFSKAE
jgi:hypothetical protein